MSSIEEKRVYADHEAGETLLVAAPLGVLEVGVVGDTVGKFGVAHRCTARDVAAGGTVAVATDEDVLLGSGFEPTGFGPAVAVTTDPLVAAGPDGRIARREDGGWVTLGTVGEARAVDGELLAAADGVYRVGDGLDRAGLDDARDVAAAGPFAATAAGVFRLGNGWLAELDADARVVAAGGGRAHAATADALYARADGDWHPVSLPVDERVADVAHGAATYAVTDAGTVLVDAGDGWRSRALGVAGATALAIRS